MTTIRIDDCRTSYFCIYVVKSSETGLVEVGRTRNLGERLSHLTAQMGKHPLTLLCAIPTHDPRGIHV